MSIIFLTSFLLTVLLILKSSNGATTKLIFQTVTNCTSSSHIANDDNEPEFSILSPNKNSVKKEGKGFDEFEEELSCKCVSESNYKNCESIPDDGDGDDDEDDEYNYDGDAIFDERTYLEKRTKKTWSRKQSGKFRIVNRPPQDGDGDEEQISCPNGQFLCCSENDDSPTLPVPDKKACGRRKILQVPYYTQLKTGEAAFGKYPWYVLLMNTTGSIGGGVLINRQFVLTAAHKVKNWRAQRMRVRVGEWDLRDEREPYKKIDILADRVYLRKDFNGNSLVNDIALIKLARPLELTSSFPHINSACLPKDVTLSDYVGKRCWVSGFGKEEFNASQFPRILREVDLKVFSHSECENKMRSTRLGPNFILDKSFLCAGGESGKDACYGDGGSPLVCEKSTGQFEVIGLVAWGIGCAQSNIPGVYVNVLNYLQWINNIITS